ncbi:MAG: hypothetical protein IPQ07_01910 [Myxococcales bacterium]|nr:hypothetical protein [Myxococcales bacterium]
MRLRVSIAVGIASCSSPAPPCPATGKDPIYLELGGVPSLIAVRDGDAGEWTEPALREGGGYDACVTDDFMVVVVCTRNDGTFATEQRAAVYADGDQLGMSPCGYPPPGPTVTITGEMEQPGIVFVGGSGVVAYQPQSPFSFAVVAGTYDLIATNAYDDFMPASPRVLVRRGQRFREPMSIGPVSLADDGVDTMVVPLAIAGLLPDDTVTTSTKLTTAASRVEVEIADHKGPTAYVLPSSALVPTDRQRLDVQAGAGGYARFSSTEVSGGASIQLLPRLTNVELLNDGARWTSLPVADFTWISARVGGNGGRQVAFATRSWLELHGASAVHFDTTPPGYDLRWVVAQPRSWNAELVTIDGETLLATTFGVVMN